EEHNILLPLDEAQGVQALELLAFDARLKGEVKVRECFHRRQSRTAHGRLQATRIAERDVCSEQALERFPCRELAGVDVAQDVIERLERTGHLEIGELCAQPLA